MAAMVHRVDMKQIALRLEMPRLFGFRMWLAIWLLRLVAYICPLTIAVDTSSDELPLPGHRTFQVQKGVEIPNQMALGERGFDHDLAMRLDIYLDGVKQDQVVAYDVDAGAIRRNVLGADGRPQLNATRDAVLRETVRGKVEIVLAR